jgi:hypothetical protein
MLMNIYLSTFDHFMRKLKAEYDRGKPSSNATSEWRKATWVSAKELSGAKSKESKSRLKRDLYRQKVKLATKAGIPRKALTNKQQGGKVYHKVHYVRYADDYVITIKGPKSLALKVKTAAENFLKSSLHFDLKGGDLIHARHEKFSFLGFDIKLPGRNERDIVENRRILSFKKIRNRITNRKKNLEGRFMNAMRKTYESELKSALLELSKQSTSKVDREQKVAQLARNEASNIGQKAMSIGQKWSPTKGPFKEWVTRELKHLQESWTQHEDLKKLGMNQVIKTYEEFVIALKDSISNDKLEKVRTEEISKLKEKNPDAKQMHIDRLLYGQPQGLNLRIYAPIREIKEKLVT